MWFEPSPVYYAIQKYGIENFKFEKLAMLEDWMIDEAETKAIEVYKTRKPNGYNLEIGGCKTKQHHPDTIKKISENRKGRVAWNKGKRMAKTTDNNKSFGKIGVELICA